MGQVHNPWSDWGQEHISHDDELLAVALYVGLVGVLIGMFIGKVLM